MKKLLAFCIILCVLLTSALNFCVAEAAPAAAEFPALVTSGGQSADYQMVGTVMNKLGMEYTLNNLATSADIGENKTLVVVVGGSSKGLGAAGIDADAELARLEELITASKEAGLSIVAMHTGGNTRRGDLSDKFIAPVFEKADYAVIVSGGDTDGLMSGICEANGIEYQSVETLTKVMEILPGVFASEAPAEEAEAATGAGAQFPALVTSGGQSADYQMVGTVMNKLGMEYTLNNLATSADLGENKTLVVVVGGSSKGLGAAGIDADAELARLEELITAAKESGLSIVAMHTGGNTRSGDLSDKFIAPVFEKADYAVIVSGGDTDGLMSGICEANGIEYQSVETLTKVMEILPGVFASEAPAEEAEAATGAGAQFPALVTSGGQSADYQMVGTVMNKLGMEYTLNNLATSADLGENKTLVVVVGGSSKGLGAAGIDADAELARLEELITAAKESGLSIVAMHTGGNTRRGDLSDKFIAPVFEKADQAVIVSGGDTDGLMSGICEEKGIPYQSVETLTKVMEILPGCFGGAAETTESAATESAEAETAATEEAKAESTETKKKDNRPLITFIVMVVVFLLGCFLCKLPVSISMVLASIAGTLVAGLGVPVAQLAEGMFSYVDTILVISTAMIFMKVIQECGTLDAICSVIVEKFHKVPAIMLILIMLIIMFPGMITGSSTASVLTAGAIMAPILMTIGVPKDKTGAIIAMGGILGMIAPPTNIPAMIIGAGIDIPYSGFGLPLALLTFPLAFLFVLAFAYKHVRKIDYAAVSARLNTEARKKYGFRIYIPLILVIVLMILTKCIPSMPQLGMPLIFLISALVGCFCGKKFKLGAVLKDSIHDSLPVMGILMGVGMFIQVMTLTGVRGLIVTACLSLPEWARYIGMSVSMPLFGAVSSFGSASVLGVPFLLSFLAKEEIIVAAALSLIASLGDMMPPTALAGIFAAQVVGEKKYTIILKKCLLPCLIVILWAVLFILLANVLAPYIILG